MKVYFEDGKLREGGVKEVNANASLSADYGISACYEWLNAMNEMHPDYIIYTNCIFALESPYNWDQDEEYHQVYLRRNNNWILIKDLTERELRFAHNIPKLYVANAFERKIDNCQELV